jgi:hypothetical protein
MEDAGSSKTLISPAILCHELKDHNTNRPKSFTCRVIIPILITLTFSETTCKALLYRVCHLEDYNLLGCDAR